MFTLIDGINPTAPSPPVEPLAPLSKVSLPTSGTVIEVIAPLPATADPPPVWFTLVVLVDGVDQGGGDGGRIALHNETGPLVDR